jgi:hypothetical protein
MAERESVFDAQQAARAEAFAKEKEDDAQKRAEKVKNLTVLFMSGQDPSRLKKILPTSTLSLGNSLSSLQNTFDAKISKIQELVSQSPLHAAHAQKQFETAVQNVLDSDTDNTEKERLIQSICDKVTYGITKE